jgi:hypothetical protein
LPQRVEIKAEEQRETEDDEAILDYALSYMPEMEE